jgi:hypothetical protein
MARDCPSCGITNAPTAQRCDCGYDFLAGHVRDSYLYYLDPSQRGRNPLGFTGINAELPFLIKEKVNRLTIEGRLTKVATESSEPMNAAIRKLLQLTA